ncbi:MAG: SRPBCC family protein [Bacteroidota bacterium]
MKYSTEVTIAQPRAKVVELFDNSDNLYQWMDGLKSFEHLSGEPGQPGAKSKLLFQMGKREVTMTETILDRELPERFSGTYEGPGVWNRVENVFQESENGKTIWVANHEFKFRGMMSVISLFMRGAFKKQTTKTMESFRAFAEKAE